MKAAEDTPCPCPFVFFKEYTPHAPPRPASPLPPAERALPAVQAKLWMPVTREGGFLEGAQFERSGSLLVCDMQARSVLRIAPDGSTLRTALQFDEWRPSGPALLADGRLLTAASDWRGSGAILAVNADGSTSTIVGKDAGYVPNDLAPGAGGGLYFSCSRGAPGQPAGGVYYLAPDMHITPIIPNMNVANGVALSPDGSVLWATEYGRALLHRVELDGATGVRPFGASTPWHFSGAKGPDSMRVDAQGNVYVALYGQGRVLIFNPQGIPVGQVLLEGRDAGRYLLSSSLAIAPSTAEMYIAASSEDGASAIFRAPALAPGLPAAADAPAQKSPETPDPAKRNQP